MKKLFATLFLLTCIPANLIIIGWTGMTALADDTPTFLPAPEISVNKATIDRLQTYLSNLTTIISDFTQTAPDGTLSSGKFFLERPGRMRWQYNPPTPILMVSNGSELVYYDYELQQSSHIPLDQTLIGFLAQERIRFDTDTQVGITDLSIQPGVIRISLAQRDKPGDGQLMLEFSDRPLLLRNMVIRDATHQVTTVSLNNARFGVDIDPKLFDFREPGHRKIGRQ